MAPATTELDVSILIVSWNTRDILLDCLRSVYAQTRNSRFEVIVVDNASSDGSADMVRRDFPQATLIVNPDNKGFAAANNQGIDIAKGRYVLLLNSDTVVLDGAVDRTIIFADAHPEAGVVGCRVLNSDRALQRSCFMFPSVTNLLIEAAYLDRLFPKSRLFGREYMTWWDAADSRAVESITGCFMLVRREAIDRVGKLDEGYFMYCEEADWCYRFGKTGWKVVYTPEAQIIHLGGGSSSRIRLPMRLQLRSGILLFIRKHRSLLSYVLACAVVSLFFGSRVPFWLVKAGLSRRTRVADWQTARAYAAGSIKALGGWQRLAVK
jgi:GT2 family glycosyltransferase